MSICTSIDFRMVLMFTANTFSEVSMRVSSRCSVAIHILVLVAWRGESGKVTSALLAKSTGCNPVIVRTILSALKKAGIISVKRGPGGAALARTPEEISLLDIYNALETASFAELIGRHPSPEPMCPVGGSIYGLLAEPYAEIGRAFEHALAAIPLSRILDSFHATGSAAP